MEEGKTYHTTDDELGKLLHQLIIVDGEPEVEIHHPVDGQVIVTRENYQAMLDSLQKARDMSPAERLEETKRLERKMQMRFRTAMISAEFYTVDIDDEANFGKDVEGNEINMDGMHFIPVQDYLKGIKKRSFELGAFVSESMHKPPIRILANQDPDAVESTPKPNIKLKTQPE